MTEGDNNEQGEYGRGESREGGRGGVALEANLSSTVNILYLQSGRGGVSLVARYNL